ncbi:HTH-type transcriptional regulator BetI [Ruegeria sp. THAF57]|uniref:TetR/AcrR family transcriptional regulator n=1 Tax=Ruegeria sp. THAF57 TaxID=2744555 RepID=UPI00176376A5|nr:TetR/AcrR family transcriptional regulator [Ruegeria sp. THAF57]CAD0187254.1 HTH-type transcriptional regulator BetI [Ruegeria sp. THAF57]
MLVASDHSPEALCRSMLERNSDTISIRNPEVAIKKLVVIIETALEISNRKGFHAMSLRELSKEAGISMGGLYAYFDSKTTLLNMILSQVATSVHDVLKNAPEDVTKDPITHLRWLISAHIHLTEDMVSWFAFCFMEAKSFPETERQMAIESSIFTEQVFADVINRAVAQNLLRPDVSPLLPSLIKPLLQDWYVKRSKYRKRGISVKTYVQTVQDFVLAATLPASGSENQNSKHIDQQPVGVAGNSA